MDTVTGEPVDDGLARFEWWQPSAGGQGTGPIHMGGGGVTPTHDVGGCIIGYGTWWSRPGRMRERFVNEALTPPRSPAP
jgi:hypothetical protein